MLIVSLLLAGTAIAISAIALVIAAYHDLRNRDLRARSRQHASVAPLHSAPPTLRLWEQPPLEAIHEAVTRSAHVPQSRNPDIIVGPWPAATDASPAEGSPQRKAA